jgi:adenine-specific DNA-methyltransferase
MVGREPVASVNAARASYTNTIHGLKFDRSAIAPAAAIGLHSTLTLLSMELHGRTYGGGILKLEPSEAARVHVALPSDTRAAIQLSHLLRSGEYLEAVALADQVVLRDSVGLSRTDIGLLAAARARLVSRRYSRNQRRNIQ